MKLMIKSDCCPYRCKPGPGRSADDLRLLDESAADMELISIVPIFSRVFLPTALFRDWTRVPVRRFDGVDIGENC